MTINVFGEPITNNTLEAMHEYHGRTITREDRAHVALNRKNDDHKYEQAREYVKKLKGQWGTGISTLCLIYNATGDTITYACDHDWYGHVGPGPYPTEIDNGQWGGVLHVKTAGVACGSIGAVVYHGENNDGTHCDWMASWSNPWNRDFWNNQVYTQIREKWHYHGDSHWNDTSEALYKSGLNHSEEWNGCVSKVVIEESTSPIFEAIFTLNNA